MLTFSPFKHLGQHFLNNYNILSRIITCADSVNDKHIYDVGAGMGSLTAVLLEKTNSQIIAIEKDIRCIPHLDVLVKQYPGRLRVLNADFLKLTPENIKNKKIIANLPYCISVHILLKWFYNIHEYDDYTVLIQKEVANRLVAKKGSKDYSGLSVLAQTACNIQRKFNIHGNSFSPPTKVVSTLIHCKPHKFAPSQKLMLCLSKILHSCFQHRRKMVRKALMEILGDHYDKCIQLANIDGTMRPEEISVEQWQTLADKYYQIYPPLNDQEKSTTD